MPEKIRKKKTKNILVRIFSKIYRQAVSFKKAFATLKRFSALFSVLWGINWFA